MKILHLIPSLQKGGAERLCLDIVQAQNQLPGTESRLAIMHAENEYASEYPGIKPLCLNSRVIPSLRKSWTVHTQEWEALLNEFKPDVIHSHLFEAEMLSRYQVRPGIRYISHCHDNMHQLKALSVFEWTSKKRLTEAYERRFLLKQYAQANNRFLAISPDTKKYFTEQLPACLAKNVILFPNAVDVSRFSAQRSNSHWGETLRLINVGSFVPKKNQAFLVDVMQELHQRGIKAQLTLAGEGTLKNEVQRKAQVLGLSDYIDFPGKVSSIEQHMAESHVYVHSAIYEPFGLVLIEAMASGLPVVSLNGHGNKELVENGKNGFLIEKQNPVAFVNAIKTITENEESYLRFSKNAISFAAQYDIKAYVQKLMALYTHSLNP